MKGGRILIGTDGKGEEEEREKRNKRKRTEKRERRRKMTQRHNTKFRFLFIRSLSLGGLFRHAWNIALHYTSHKI